MKKYLVRWLPLLLIGALLLSGCAAAPAVERGTVTEVAPEETLATFVLIEEDPTEEATEEPTEEALPEDGHYTSKEEVVEYILTYGHLPDNFISKKEAKAQGWDGSAKTLRKLFPGMSIGGDHFGNYENLLPQKKGRRYTECDINFNGKSRGAERIVFSNDGLIYYTGDHYATFELLYGEE